METSNEVRQKIDAAEVFAQRIVASIDPVNRHEYGLERYERPSIPANVIREREWTLLAPVDPFVSGQFVTHKSGLTRNIERAIRCAVTLERYARRLELMGVTTTVRRINTWHPHIRQAAECWLFR